MLIHPTKWGYRNNKINKMKNMNTTLEIPEGSKAVISGKVIDGKNYLVVEVEQEPELKQGDLAIFWNYEPREAIIAIYKQDVALWIPKFVCGNHVDHTDRYWRNAIKWDGTKEQYERVLRGEI